MANLKKLFSLLRRIWRGDDIVLVPQPQDIWDTQFSNGVWDRLLIGEDNIRMIAERISSLRRHGPLRVLDVGCGNGALGMLLAQHPAITYIGIDFSEPALTQARQQVPNGTFICADVDAPPSTLGVFDVLVFSEVLYYVEPRKVLPLYKVHATHNAYIIVSVMRFLRSPFIWNRIRKAISIGNMISVRNNASRRVTWDIAIGNYTQDSKGVI